MANSRQGRRRRRGSSGQASVELLAILPLLVVVVLIVAQGLPMGWALWSAASAARAGARADHVGSDGEAVARRALPARLRRDARIESDGELRVTVAAPALIPGAPSPRLGVAAKLDPGGG